VGDNILCGGISVYIRKYMIAYPIKYYTFVIMKRMVWEFLNIKFEGVLIYHQRFNVSDKIIEKFITDRGSAILDFHRFHSGKEVRTRVNYFVRKDVKAYFDIHEIDIEMYVLEWCRDKSCKTIEM
jgi:hypothetical protein